MGIEPAIDITTEQRKTVLALLEKHLPNTTAWVYGSRAKWTARPQSDLDMVVFATPEQSSQVFALREAFAESNLPFRVDLFVWDDVPERFRKYIKQDYVVLVGKEERGVKDGWNTVTLGEFAPFTYGKGLPVGKRNPSGVIPVFGSNGIVGYHDSSLTDGPTIIIGRKGTVGAVHYSSIPCWPIDTTFFITGNDPALVKFKYYALSMLGLEHMNSDSAGPGLNRSDAHARTLLVPEEFEQRTISHILGTLDDKIELNRRMNETLEEMARALFKSWFVDFDPVRANMEGRDTGLPPNVAALFPDRLVGSELGEIPEGWEVGCFGDIVEQNRDKESPFATPDTVFRHFSIPAFDKDQWPQTERGENIKSQKSRVPPEAILLSKLNPEIERVWFADVASDERAICSTEFLVLQARPPFQRSYVYCLTRSPLFRQQIESLVTDTSKSHQRAPAGAVLALGATIPIGTSYSCV
ncbi:MAG: restriction endonuclease subunit S [Candidatus Latescibacteria bacterium]|nr:restriction endonuclease subunit S [Candidatus Latescibacterota bacterium]